MLRKLVDYAKVNKLLFIILLLAFLMSAGGGYYTSDPVHIDKDFKFSEVGGFSSTLNK